MSLNKKDSEHFSEQLLKLEESTLQEPGVMIANDSNDKNMLDILEECSTEIESNLDILHSDLLFLKHGFNLVIGESKSGKTFTMIKSLVDAGLKDQIIHIDFDRNADSKLKELEVETYHINNAKELFDKFEPHKKFKSLSDKILIIDSLQDLGLDEGIDTNSAALNTMNRVAKFGDTGATLIVIHHITLKDNDEAKIKGNATTISSKADTTLLFTRKGNIRTMKVLNTRAEDKILSGKEIIFGVKKEKVKKNICA